MSPVARLAEACLFHPVYDVPEDVPERLPALDLRTRIVAGRDEILALQPLLAALSARCGQSGAMDHLEYFLTSKEALKKRPHLVLLGPNLHRPGARPESAIAALLVYEYCLLGCGTGVFATDDTSGRRTLIAPEHLRVAALEMACTAVMRAGGQIIVMSMLEERTDEAPIAPVAPIRANGAWRLASREREIPSYLALESTMDATLAKIGQRTRSNMRYYRRRAEAQLGSAFVADVAMDRAGFQAFNRECAYAVPDEQAGRRYDALRRVPGMFLSGIQDRDCRWLSMIGGRRYHDRVEIDWQMNRNDLPAYSLCTVMRAYQIEHEIHRGTRKLYIEGGTPHAMRFSFAMDTVRDVGLVKRSWLAFALRSLALRILPPKNFVLEMLKDEAMSWSMLA